jgi:hypothetical protein
MHDVSTASLIGAFVDDNPGEAGRKPLPVSRQRKGKAGGTTQRALKVSCLPSRLSSWVR